MEWQDKARSLTFGQKRKVPHCGPDPSAYISNRPVGLSLHCFRCGANEFVPHGRLSASDILAMRKDDDEETKREYPEVVALHDPEVPTPAHLWVLKAGITPERASEQYGFGWSDRSSRVIVPILHDGQPTGLWTGRAIDGRKPKYITGRNTRGAMWFWGKYDAPVCVTEDVLSAIRVKEAGYNSLAALGTTISLETAGWLASRCLHGVIGWFDGDKAGRAGYVKLRKALSPYGVDPKRIQTVRDPKQYSRLEIIKFIEDRT